MKTNNFYGHNSKGAQGVYAITESFEKALCEYTGSPYAIAVDCCSHAIFLSLMYEKYTEKLRDGDTIVIPARTFVSVPMEIKLAGLKVEFSDAHTDIANLRMNGICGKYRLYPSRVWDSSLHFTRDMYESGDFMCVSFTGPTKHLKLSKGGAILLDDPYAYEWLKRARTSGRREQSYHTDTFDMIGWNFYMMPEIAARGLLLMRQFYTESGEKKGNEDVYNEYPDLSKHVIFR